MKIHRKIPVCLLVAAAASQWAFAQTAPTTSLATAAPAPVTNEEITQLTPFEVNVSKDNGYAATETLAGTRIRTNLADVGSAISIVTKQMMQDIGATDSSTLLQYTTNAEVSGTRGTYAGLGNAQSVDETANLRAPDLANRVRGLAAADNTRDFFVTDIPWDSYIVDRVDIQRGPNSILFGLGSPAGIVNASTHNAEFRNFGSAEVRTGSYSTTRSSLDFNQQVIPHVLSIRVDGMWNNQKYEQKPAFQNDRRVFGAIRFDPQLFNRRDFQTSIKVKYEFGDIDANRPRIIPPNDAITAWFRPANNTSLTGGMGKLAISSGYVTGSNPGGYNPWLAGYGDQQQPLWFLDGITSQQYRIYGGYVNTGALNNNGTNRGSSNNLIGQTYSPTFFGLASLPTFANNARITGFQYGQYRTQSLQDPTVFDFYNHLIDGPTKSEFEKWNAYNIDISQSMWDDRVAIDLTYDRQKYKRGGQMLLGAPTSSGYYGNPTLTIDVLQAFQDLAANPNYGRPYVQGGPGGGGSYFSDRKYKRASVFGEVRATDFFHNDFLVRLFGKQRFNGVYSDENYYTENRAWQMYANSLDWDAYWNQSTGLTSGFKTRPPFTVIYLGDSIANMSSASGAFIPGITVQVAPRSGNIYHFASTWKNLPGVNPADPWTVPANLTTIFNPNNPPTGGYTQASNPANYVGWNSSFMDNLVIDDMGNNPELTTIAQKSVRVTKSYAGSWQGYMWNNAIIPTLGWRYDEVQGKNVTAPPVTNNRSELDLSPSVYKLPNVYPANQIFKNHSTAGGVVVHLNRLFGERDRLPFNLSLSYNKSNNFQVTDVRRDVYGNAIPNPTGATKEYGLMLSTKDNKYSLRVTKYDTRVKNGTAPLDLSGLAGTITQGIKFRNVFLYKMSNYTWASREQTVDNPGVRYFWTPAYLDANGRPVADLNGSPSVPSGATLETQTQADVHRDASIRAWNDIQRYLQGKGFFSAWNYTPTTLSALTDRSTYAATLTLNGSTDGLPIPAAQYQPDPTTLANYSAIAPQGLSVTTDSESKGYEIEFTANPTDNWRFAFNAAKANAVRSNVGGPVLDQLVSYLDQQMAGVAGDMRQFNGNYVANNEVRQNWANWRGNYTLLKLQEGSAASELRKWRYNVITNYSFTRGTLKGANAGAAYRWQDKVVIGYPVIPGTGNIASFDLSKPYYGPSEGSFDLWAGYQRKLTDKINWKIQLNVYNVGQKDKLIPVSVEPDGHTWATVRVAPVQEWMLTNTFSF